MDYCSPLRFDYSTKYDDNARGDLIQFVVEPPHLVLEVGCGSGTTGYLLKQKFPQTRYVGIESEEKAAAIAGTRLDRIIVANIEQVDFETLEFAKESFDLIVFADVLEHLYDPWKVLAAVKDYLKPEGKILASIPNTQNVSLILHLLNGNWSYSAHGLLDATHIRFFTFDEIFRLFSGTGYAVVQCSGSLQQDIENDTWPKDLEFGKLVLKQVTKDEAFRLFAFQYFVIAQKTQQAL
jgi:2-polyprenyl-3-methyl-5-hydroxy-6-metoxy-1,4-benzoquinol methylase